MDVDVRSGAELLDKKLKDVIVHAINSGTFTVEACVPVFARFVYIRNKVRTCVHVRGGLFVLWRVFCDTLGVRACVFGCLFESKLVLTSLYYHHFYLETFVFRKGHKTIDVDLAARVE